MNYRDIITSHPANRRSSATLDGFDLCDTSPLIGSVCKTCAKSSPQPTNQAHPRRQFHEEILDDYPELTEEDIRDV